MVSNLKDNGSLTGDEKAAKDGPKNGGHYMIVTLLISSKERPILTNHPEQMTIDYQTSSGHSFIAGK